MLNDSLLLKSRHSCKWAFVSSDWIGRVCCTHRSSCWFVSSKKYSQQCWLSQMLFCTHAHSSSLQQKPQCVKMVFLVHAAMVNQRGTINFQTLLEITKFQLQGLTEKLFICCHLYIFFFSPPVHFWTLEQQNAVPVMNKTPALNCCAPPSKAPSSV